MVVFLVVCTMVVVVIVVVVFVVVVIVKVSCRDIFTLCWVFNVLGDISISLYKILAGVCKIFGVGLGEVV